MPLGETKIRGHLGVHFLLYGSLIVTYPFSLRGLSWCCVDIPALCLQCPNLVAMAAAMRGISQFVFGYLVVYAYVHREVGRERRDSPLVISSSLDPPFTRFSARSRQLRLLALLRRRRRRRPGTHVYRVHDGLRARLGAIRDDLRLRPERRGRAPLQVLPRVPRRTRHRSGRRQQRGGERGPRAEPAAAALGAILMPTAGKCKRETSLPQRGGGGRIMLGKSVQ